MIPTASLLEEHGIQFRKKVKRYSRISNSFLDISFKNGIIEQYIIEDNASSIYRNLLAFEQSSQTDHENKFTRYVNFMDNLIDTTDDVALLTKRKILGNNLGSVDEMAKLFNKMCIGLSIDSKHHYLVEVYNEINRYCDRPINK
ncbi:hypothetical protein ZOSMA_13G01290 [Zostera marina]|uniref:Uncharacterized protein n=1 Tax=Zostera marina TaxID=29655 RepID=A0A0K9PY18_ZOSMR|nr:hypothetical protein ZOSMA_13G01290 [Zostera marina]